MPSAELLSALQAYADALAQKFSATTMDGAPEDQLKTPIENLLRATIPLVKIADGDVQVSSEVREESIGRPDLGVALGGLLTGYIELKAPDKPANPNKLKGHDKKQWQKFQALPNLIYTNGREWRLYQRVDDGKQFVLEQVGKPVNLGDIIEDGAEAITPKAAEAFEDMLRHFALWVPVTPSTPRKLASLIAPLTRILREDVTAALGVEGSNVQAIADEWRQTLFPEADDARFADAYAQTVTYALLLARLEGSKDAEHAAKTLKVAHPLLADILQLLTNDKLVDELGVGLKMLVRVVDSLDMTAFEGEGDPWLYFYEDFLAEYDPKLRKEAGVYYTPQEVIGFQIRTADELLRTRLGKARGIANEGVILLDPATGTGAYPLNAIEYAGSHYAKLGKGTVASRLAKQLYAIEILVGPYTVAHLRVTQAITQAGGTLPDSGAQVYLGDTLDSPFAEIPGGLGFVYKPLTDERKRVQQLKREVPVMVCFGNPPYRRWPAEDADAGIHYGGWVRHGDEGENQPPPILDTFADPVKEAGGGVYLRNLYNDYVAFWRWAMWKVFENPNDPRQSADRAGIVSFITASSYLRGPAFGGMREHMRRTFDELWIIDLGGDNYGSNKSENVFVIQSPVCIAIGIRNGKPDPEKAAQVRYKRVEGTREEKLAWLVGQKTLEDIDWQDCPEDWQAPLMPRGEGTYWDWPLLTEVFPEQFTGAKYHRKWPIAETKEVLQSRWDMFLAADEITRREMFGETRDRTLHHAPPTIKDPNVKGKPLQSLKQGESLPRAERFGFRSFDRMWILADSRLGDYTRPELWRSIGKQQIFLASLLTNTVGSGPAVTASIYVPDLHYFSGRGGKDIIPLYLDAEATKPNVRAGLLELLGQHYGAAPSAEDLFAYTYALLSTPTYEERFREDLTIPGPRLPLTLDTGLFERVAAAGRELLHLHTYGERMGAGGMPEGKAGVLVDISGKPEDYPDEFSYNSETGVLHVGTGQIEGVSAEVWEFSVSGLRPLRSWLGYRMKNPSGKQTGELAKIRPERWTPELTEELLELIWLLEGTLERWPKLADLLTEVLAGEVLTEDKLPQPEQQVELEQLEGAMFEIQRVKKGGKK